MRRVYDQQGRLREQWSADTRTYTAWDATGAQTATRAFTAAENAEADAYLAALSRDGNRDTLTTQVGADLAVLRTSIDTLQTIVDKANNQVTAADTKQVARECRRLARQMVALTRLATGDVSSTDTGTP